MDILFRGVKYTVKLDQYPIGNGVAIMLVNKEDEDDVEVVSVNMPGKVGDGKVAIKDYSEYEGILDVLVTAGVVSDPVCYVQSGFVSIPVCAVTHA